MQLIFNIPDAEADLLPYYAQIAGVDISVIEDPTDQATAVADTLKKKYRQQAIELKAKAEAEVAAEAVREQYS